MMDMLLGKMALNMVMCTIICSCFSRDIIRFIDALNDRLMRALRATFTPMAAAAVLAPEETAYLTSFVD